MLNSFQVVAVSTLTEAKTAFEEAHDEFMAIISDFHIRDGDGLELHSWIRQRSGIPFLLISGSIPALPERPGLGFLAKPFNQKALHDKLFTMLEENAFSAR